MNELPLKPTDHNTECSNTNYYVDGLRNFGQEVFGTWQAFKEAYRLTESFQLSHNEFLCFRYDLKEERDEEDELTGDIGLYLYLMYQQKGKYVPVRIERIQEGDMEEIQEYLQSCWRYMQGLWTEFSGVENMYPLIKL